MTVRSLTSFDKSASSFLAARDSRQAVLLAALGQGHRATVFVSLNIPGLEKTPPGSEALFLFALEQLHAEFHRLATLDRGSDALGPYAVLALDADPVAVKKRCVVIESRDPSMRLLDLDIYAADASQIGRNGIGLAARTCLLCDQPAVECIRAKRHPFQNVIDRVHDLLARHRA